MLDTQSSLFVCRTSNSDIRGGIRGIVELEILRQIEQALGGRLAIQCFFELIVGTGLAFNAPCCPRVNTMANIQ